MRIATAHLIAPVLRATGFRFSKNYRWEITRFHSFVYRHVDVVLANVIANRIRPIS